MEPLLFPCLVAAGGRLLRAPKNDVLRFWVKRHLNDNRFLLANGASDRVKLTFIIDRSGRFRRVHEIAQYRRWARRLAWLYDFVLIECEISPGESVTNASLLERLRTLKEEREFRTIRELRKFLSQQPPTEVFDSSRFRQFWAQHGPALPPEEWTRQYPEVSAG